MELTMFSFGQAILDSVVRYIPQPALPVPTTDLPGTFNPKQLVTPPTFEIVADHQGGTLDLEDYRENAAQYREQSILRAAASSIKLGKNEDGTIWVGTTDPQALLAEKRAGGGDKQISWDTIKINFDFRSMGMGETYALDSVALNLDFFASEYAQYKTRIEQQYTGEEQQTELAKLEDTFASRVGEFAANFAETVGGFLQTNGVAGEQDAIRNSFLDIYDQRKTEYLNFIAENPDYAQVKGTEDEWLLTDGNFMGEQLRYAYISQHPEMNLTSQYGYSVDDLNAAGTLVKELTKVEHNLPERSKISEEELGMELGLAAMKYAVISGHFKLSANVKSKLEQSLNHFIQRQIEAVSDSIEWNRQDPYIHGKAAYALDFKQQIVLGIIQRMVKDLNSAEDVNSAFKSDFNTVAALYKKKAADFQTGSLSRYYAGYSSWLNKDYVSDWNNFVRQLSTSNQDESRYLFKDQMQLLDISV